MHGKNHVKNTGHISMIFKKNKDGSYTRSSLLYQDILKYSIDGKFKENDNKSFRLWNLTRWLLEVNMEFINHFKDPSTWNYTKANRIESRLDRIKIRVDELVNIGLIFQSGTAKESKGTGIVPIFQFTIVGNVIAWILESMNVDKRQYALDQLYNLFQINFKDNKSSTDSFNSLYFQKLKEHGLFGNYIDRYKELLKSESPVMNRHGFFQHLLILPTYNVESDIDFWSLWYNSVLQLDPDKRQLLMHHTKLDIERRAEDECHAFGDFEKVRFECRDNPNSVTIEGYCRKCNLYTTAAFKLDGYLAMVNKAYPNGIIVTKCPNCNKDDSLDFPILI